MPAVSRCNWPGKRRSRWWTRASARNWSATARRNADEDATSGQGKEAVKRFVRDHGINYPIGLMNGDTYVELAKVMGFNAEEGFSIPTTMVLGRNGLVVKRYPGYFLGQEQELEKVVSDLIEAETGST